MDYIIYFQSLIVIASHVGGFAGVGLTLSLAALLYELEGETSAPADNDGQAEHLNVDANDQIYQLPAGFKGSECRFSPQHEASGQRSS